jgi:hypothetical protein
LTNHHGDPASYLTTGGANYYFNFNPVSGNDPGLHRRGQRPALLGGGAYCDPQGPSLAHPVSFLAPFGSVLAFGHEGYGNVDWMVYNFSRRTHARRDLMATITAQARDLRASSFSARGSVR